MRGVPNELITFINNLFQMDPTEVIQILDLTAGPAKKNFVQENKV